jgi:hypothetical protein
VSLATRLRDLATDIERGACPPGVVRRLRLALEPASERLARRDLWLCVAARHVGNSPTRLHRIARRLAAARGSGGDIRSTAPVAVAIQNALDCGPLPSRRRLAEILGGNGTKPPTG